MILKDGYLQYNGVDVKKLIDKYGTPLNLLSSQDRDADQQGEKNVCQSNKKA